MFRGVKEGRGSDIHEDEHSGSVLFTRGDPLLAAKGKNSPDDFAEREMRGQEWDTPKQLEIAKIAELNACTEVNADDPRIKGMKVCETMWTGRRKRNADGSTKKAERPMRLSRGPAEAVLPSHKQRHFLTYSAQHLATVRGGGGGEEENVLPRL